MPAESQHKENALFNREIFNAALAAYKRDFAELHWENEQYKRQAVKHFQEHWDIQAADFPEMLRRAFDDPLECAETAAQQPLLRNAAERLSACAGGDTPNHTRRQIQIDLVFRRTHRAAP